MRRILVAFALASLPAVIAAQNAVSNDRLNLDLYWEYETVSDPQLSPDGAQILYTRGWLDKINDKRESSLWIMSADGSKNRFLVRGSSARWSPTGDRIVYQRLTTTSGERHEVVLVNVADKSETVIGAPETDGQLWYPFTVSWSPDGTTLLYAAWADDGEGEDGVIAVPADMPSDARVLSDSIDPGGSWSHRWTRIQMWGRQPR